MLSNESSYHKQFHDLLDQIGQEVQSLNEQIIELKKENTRLKTKLEELQEGQTDIYSAISDSERLALRHQVIGLISKIDDHLEE